MNFSTRLRRISCISQIALCARESRLRFDSAALVLKAKRKIVWTIIRRNGYIKHFVKNIF